MAAAQNAVTGKAVPCVRNTFALALDRHLPDAARRGDPLSVVLVAIDNARDLSDGCRVRIGDETLETVGKTFIASVRATDCVARFDATTFAFLLTDTEHASALMVAERLRKVVSAVALPAGAGSIRLTLSIGTSDFVLGDSSASILRRAEEAMIAAAQAGGDCIRSRLGGQFHASSNRTGAVVCQS